MALSYFYYSKEDYPLYYGLFNSNCGVGVLQKIGDTHKHKCCKWVCKLASVGKKKVSIQWQTFHSKENLQCCATGVSCGCKMLCYNFSFGANLAVCVCVSGWCCDEAADSQRCGWELAADGSSSGCICCCPPALVLLYIWSHFTPRLAFFSLSHTTTLHAVFSFSQTTCLCLIYLSLFSKFGCTRSS